MIGRVAARLARKPVVYTPHGFPFVGEMSEARRRFGVVAERALAPITDAIIGVCEFERDLGREQGLKTRIEVVHNGCPPCADVAVAPGDRARSKARSSARSARCGARSGIDVLLDAMPAVLAARARTRSS